MLSSRKIFIDNSESFLKEESDSAEKAKKCKCIKQVFCKSNDPRDYSKSINSKLDVTLDQEHYLCGDKGSEKVQNASDKSIQEISFRELKLDDCSVIDTELEKIVKIVKEQFNQELKRRNLISTSSSENEISDDLLISSSNSSVVSDKKSLEKIDFIKELDSLFKTSDISVLSTEQCKCCEGYFKDKELAKVESRETEELEARTTCGEEIKICKPRESIFVHFEQSETNSCFEEQIVPFKLDNLGKSEEIGKWGKCLDLTDEVKEICRTLLKNQNLENRDSVCRLESKKDKMCLPAKICGDDFDNVNRFMNIGNQGFSILCRKLMTWTNCMTKTREKNKKSPHIVVHLPSFACPNEFRCRAEKTYQSLQNIQIGRLGWLENKASQVLYICPDDINLDISLLQKLVSLVRPDVNLDNLWIIKPEKKGLKEKCISGCENIFSTPASYRRVRYLTAGRQAFIVPGILDAMDVFVACELKIAIFGPCLRFQDRLLNKNYAMNVLYEANVKQPAFVGFINFKELCSNFAEIILKYPDYKIWLIKINFGHYGYQTAIYKVNKELGEKIQNRLLCKEELENFLVQFLPKEVQFNQEIYKNCTTFIEDLERYGGIVQACPNEKYHVISLGLLNEHDTAEPLLIATADVIKLKNDIITNYGYIIPQSKVSHMDIQKLSNQVGKILLQEQYIGFYGVDIIVFENESKVQELWVINVNPYYTDLLSFNDWKMFCSKQCSCCPSVVVDNYAVCSGKLYFSGLSKYHGEELISFCREQNISYDHKEKYGCVLCPIDYNNRSIFIFSLHYSRKVAVKKFVETLRILIKLSLENEHMFSSEKKSDKHRLNVQQLAKELEKNELCNFAN